MRPSTDPHTRRYELPLSICRSGDSSVAQRHGEEHDVRETIRLYKDTKREDSMGLGDPREIVCAPT